MREKSITVWKVVKQKEVMTTICSSCWRTLSEEETQPSAIRQFGLFSNLLGERAKYVPDVVQGLGMKCNRCGVWICSKCAQRTASSANAGMIQHSNCGGMFETPG